MTDAACASQRAGWLAPAGLRTWLLDPRAGSGAVFAATILAAVLSFASIGQKSLWIDEASSIHIARDWSQMWRTLLSQDSNMWLYYLLLHWWLKLGDSEAIARSLSALFAVAAVPAVHVLGRRLFGSRAGVISAVLLAVNPFFIQYAQEARGYTLLVLLMILSTWVFVQALERQSWRWWTALGVCTALGIYTHFFASLVCLVQVASLSLLDRRSVPIRGVVISLGVAIVLLSPLALFAPFGSEPLTWIPRPTWHSVLNFFLAATGSRPLLFLYLGFCTFALVPALCRARRATDVHSRWRHLYVTAWAVLPVLLTFIFSVFATPVFIARYLIISLPALVLLAGTGIARLPRWWARFAAVTLVLFLSARCLHWWYTGVRKDDWRAVTAFVQSRAQPGDAVAFYWYTSLRPFRYYLARTGAEHPPLAVLDLAPRAANRRQNRRELDTQLLERLPAAHDRVWLILYADTAFRDLSDRPIIFDCLQARYTCTFEQDFPSIRILLFQKSP